MSSNTSFITISCVRLLREPSLPRTMVWRNTRHLTLRLFSMLLMKYCTSDSVTLLQRMALSRKISVSVSASISCQSTREYVIIGSYHKGRYICSTQSRNRNIAFSQSQHCITQSWNLPAFPRLCHELKACKSKLLAQWLACSQLYLEIVAVLVESRSGQAFFRACVNQLLPQTQTNFQPLVGLPHLLAYMNVHVLTAIAAGALYPWDNLGKARKFQDGANSKIAWNNIIYA